MSVTSTGARASARVASSPPKPAPRITTRKGRSAAGAAALGTLFFSLAESQGAVSAAGVALLGTRPDDARVRRLRRVGRHLARQPREAQHLGVAGSAGELAERSGLAPASVTGLLARLERKGLARRVPNPNDRRSVLVELVYEGMAVMGPHFLELGRQLHQLYDTFDDAELASIARFLREASQIQQEAATRIPASCNARNSSRAVRCVLSRKRQSATITTS